MKISQSAETSGKREARGSLPPTPRAFHTDRKWHPGSESGHPGSDTLGIKGRLPLGVEGHKRTPSLFHNMVERPIFPHLSGHLRVDEGTPRNGYGILGWSETPLGVIKDTSRSEEDALGVIKGTPRSGEDALGVILSNSDGIRNRLKRWQTSPALDIRLHRHQMDYLIIIPLVEVLRIRHVSTTGFFSGMLFVSTTGFILPSSQPVVLTNNTPDTSRK